MRFRTRPPRAFTRADKLHAEHMAAALVGARDSILVGDACRGMGMILQLCGVRAGDSVLCSPLGGVHTTQAIAQQRARAVFAPVHSGHFHIDPHRTADLLAQQARKGGAAAMPKALIADTLFGAPGAVQELQGLCMRYGIALIEDIGSALGAQAEASANMAIANMTTANMTTANIATASTPSARLAGSIGRFALAQWNDEKIDWGYGGMVFSALAQDSAPLHRLRQESDALTTRAERAVQALLWEKRIPLLAQELQQRRAIAARYRRNLAAVVPVQELLPGTRSACTQLAILCPHTQAAGAVTAALGEKLIPAAPCPIATDPVHLPREAAELHSRLLLLPIHSYLTAHVVDFICAQVQRGLGV